MADEDGKAFSVSAGELSSAVESAVADVLAKHNLRAVSGLALGPGTLIGRRLQESVADVATLERAAADVTAQVGKSLGLAGKTKLNPGAFIGGGHIIVGFVAEGMVQGL